MPERIGDLEDYIGDMLRGDVLYVSPQARELAIQIVMRPPVPLAARPLVELANFITIGLLPPKLRRQYGLPWDPVRGLMLRIGAEYTKRLVLPVLPPRIRYARGRAAA
jgi:uncharacterized protein (DUF2236 family)